MDLDFFLSGRSFILFNTDVELAYHIEVDNKGRFIGSCSIGRDCKEADTKSWVGTYAGVRKFFVISNVHIYGKFSVS